MRGQSENSSIGIEKSIKLYMNFGLDPFPASLVVQMQYYHTVIILDLLANQTCM